MEPLCSPTYQPIKTHLDAGTCCCRLWKLAPPSSPSHCGWVDRKNSFDDGTSRDKDRKRVAPHENIRNNNIQIGNLMPCSHWWVRGFHVLTGGRYLIWCQLRRRHLWLYTTTPIPTLSAMPTIAGVFVRRFIVKYLTNWWSLLIGWCAYAPPKCITNSRGAVI